MRARSFTDARVSFSDCTPAPDGAWRGRLIFKAWGKKTNLHCFFENLESGKTHSLCAFRSRDGSRRYSAKDGGVDFSEPGIEGRIYELQTGLNRKNNPAWTSAIHIPSGQ
jgi:hypothetical protein